MKKYIFTALLLSQVVFAQQLPVEQVINNFSKKQVEWQMPLPHQEKWTITWHERKSSLYNEGIRTFVGYIDNQMVGVISIYKNTLSGNIRHGGKEYLLSTKNKALFIKEQTSEEECGTCKRNHCSVSHHHEDKTKSLVDNKLNQNISSKLQIDNLPEIYSDGILRIYRLAILVDNSRYSSVETAKQFWAETETFLNELYMRDLSIKFEIVNNEALIRKTFSEIIFNDKNSDFITDNATKEINQLIGAENYDVGIVYSGSTTKLNGSAGMFFAYGGHTKAGGWVSVARPTTVAHELGHMFGSLHTFSQGGTDTMNTEPYRGQSVMGYNQDLPRDFFSLPSVFNIRKGIVKNSDYYIDKARKTAIGAQKSGNIIYGIDTKNQAPIIHRGKIKERYQLPQNTYFQFDIKAKDPDNDTLLYTAHQADIRIRQSSWAKVRATKATLDNVIPFYPQYELFNNGQSSKQIDYSAPYDGTFGEYTFWIGANDGGIFLENQQANHATRYDMVQTKVNFVGGTPFKITSPMKSSYTVGEKVMLTWGVDNSIFNGTKVRILMSDDLGKTWKFVLTPETDNDGSHEITIPPVEIGKIQHSPYVSSFGGVIKIEVIDHIAVAITDNNLQNGGFEVKKSDISFKNLPTQYFSVKENKIPDAPILEAITTCSNPSISVDYKGNSRNGNILTRTWEATDTCGKSATFSQYITLEKVVSPLQFIGNLPENKHIQCVKDVDTPVTLGIMGGTSPKITFTQTEVEGDYVNFTLKRTWIGTDEDAEPIMHTQIVDVQDNQKPVFSGELPKDTIVKDWADVPPMAILSATDNCDNIQVETEKRHELDNQKRVVEKRIWKAVDKSGNEALHEQFITIDPNHDPTLSVVENGTKNTTILYPNPVKDTFSLNLKNVKVVKIYNAEGRLVKTFEPQNQYNVSRLVSDVYIAIVETQNGVEKMKFIKK